MGLVQHSSNRIVHVHAAVHVFSGWCAEFDRLKEQRRSRCSSGSLPDGAIGARLPAAVGPKTHFFVDSMQGATDEAGLSALLNAVNGGTYTLVWPSGLSVPASNLSPSSKPCVTMSFRSSVSNGVDGKRAVPFEALSSLPNLDPPSKLSVGKMSGLSSRYVWMHCLISIPSRPSMMAISPPVEVPPMRSKYVAGLSGRLTSGPSIASSWCMIDSNTSSVDSPRMPPPSKESRRNGLGPSTLSDKDKVAIDGESAMLIENHRMCQRFTKWRAVDGDEALISTLAHAAQPLCNLDSACCMHVRF